jgi:ABC-type transport system substrate-binding protein
VTTKAVNFGSTDTADALIKAYKAGKYDIIGAVPIDQASQVSGATRFVSVEPEVDFLGLNSVQPGPLQNKLVREAIAYAVDPAALGKAAGSDITPLNQLIPPSIPGYNPAIPSYKHDVNKAQQLLIQAGYPKGITLQFASSSEQALATELAKELKEANITLTLKNYDNFDNFINDFTAGKNQMYYLVYTSDILDGLDIYNSTLVGTQNYKNPKLDAVLKQANDTVDPAKRLKLLQSAAVIINQDVAAVPLYSANNLWLMNKDYAVKQDMPSSFLSVYFYKVHLK